MNNTDFHGQNPDVELLPHKGGGYLRGPALMTGILAALLFLAWLVTRIGFPLTTIKIVGNTIQPAETVIRAAGVKAGDNLLEIDENKLRTNMRRNCKTLALVSVQKEYPSTLYLKVKDREPVALLLSGQVYCMVDEEGVVLEKMNAPVEGLPVFEGITDIGNLYTGQVVTFRSDTLRKSIFTIIQEFYEQMFTSQVEKVNVLNPNDITMTLNLQGRHIQVILGDGDKMRAKIGAVRTYLPYVQQLHVDGTIDVREPTHGCFLVNE